MHSDDKDSQTASVHANGKTATAHQDFLRGQICLFGICFLLCVAACAFSGVECVGLAAMVASSLERHDSKPGRVDAARQRLLFSAANCGKPNGYFFLVHKDTTSGCVSKHKVWLVASPLKALVAVFTHLHAVLS